ADSDQTGRENGLEPEDGGAKEFFGSEKAGSRRRNRERDDDSGFWKAEVETVEAFSQAEIVRGFIFPPLAIEWFLGRRDRLAENVVRKEGLWPLALLLLFSSVLFALPYGFLGPECSVREFWKIAMLYVGSMMICFPSLHIFGTYLGFRLNVQQNLAIGLVISSTAAMFSLGFAPIIWFIDYTTTAASDTPGTISFFLLLISLALGVIHMVRCFLLTRNRTWVSEYFIALLLVWLVLLFFIHYRMTKLLELVWWFSGL
ncbi:MAG: hypothetical protein ACYS8W_20575, partial [Planctomycetota bacterium]